MDEAMRLPALTREQNARIAAAFAEQQGRLRAFVRRQVDDAADVEEIVQDVFYELVVAYRLLRPIEHLAAWLVQVARHRIIDRFRAARRAEPQAEKLLESLELPPGAGPEVEYSRAVLADALEAALADLPPEQREVFIAHELEGRSFKEMARLTGVGVNTLLGRKHAAVLRLRARLRAAFAELEDSA
jgi:RNA polymerase sigma factor (sigma-70 family)